MTACKYCGKAGLTWRFSRKEGWRLYPSDGPMHACNRGLRAAQRRKGEREEPQSAEERYPEQYARYAESLDLARAQAREPGKQVIRTSFAGLPTQPMSGPEFEFDMPEKSG